VEQVTSAAATVVAAPIGAGTSSTAPVTPTAARAVRQSPEQSSSKSSASASLGDRGGDATRPSGADAGEAAAASATPTSSDVEQRAIGLVMQPGGVQHASDAASSPWSLAPHVRSAPQPRWTLTTPNSVPGAASATAGRAPLTVDSPAPSRLPWPGDSPPAPAGAGSAAGSSTGGALLFAALGAALLLVVPRLGRRLRLEPASRRPPLLAVSLERPG
jgi:hypothetical protein